jgi:hypothetical protein
VRLGGVFGSPQMNSYVALRYDGWREAAVVARRERRQRREPEEAIRKLQSQIFYLVYVIVALQDKVNAHLIE